MYCNVTLRRVRAVQYESCKIVNMQRLWKCYRKMVRNVNPDVESTARGNITTSNPQPTQLFCLIYIGTTQSQKYLGDILIS